MLFDLFLYTSLAIFLIGTAYKISTWFTKKAGVFPKNITAFDRVFACAKGILTIIFSLKIFTLLRVFILDVVFQKKILKENFLRWVMHMLIFGGFMLLLLMHALDGIITEGLFSDYYSTLNPFLFLRNFFGIMVITGLVIAIYRRFILKVPRLKTNPMDCYAIIILALIMISGIFLEGTKIMSYTEFQNMVQDYAGIDDEDELKALESLWVEKFGVVSPNVKGPFDRETLLIGKEANETNCAECHSSSKWAFTGYLTAKIFSPIASLSDRMGVATLFWYIHILACFTGLAYLPFSKMFHVIASPISLLSNAVMDKDISMPANIATRQVMELDACTHCGTCSLYCSEAVAFKVLDNEFILPSEKMVFLKSMVSGKDVDDDALKAIQQGVYLCSNCDRCTVVCPSGINLKELWVNVREALVQKGYAEPFVLTPFSFTRGLNREELSKYDYSKPVKIAEHAVERKFDSLMDKSKPLSIINEANKDLSKLYTENTFHYCFECQN